MTDFVLSRRRAIQAIALAGLALGAGPMLTACGTDDGGRGSGGSPGGIAAADVQRAAMNADPTSGAAMFGAFAGGLLHEVLRREPGNVIFSPWSITAAMAMNRAGAVGQTASQIDAAMHIRPLPAGFLDDAVNTGSQLLDARNETVETPLRSGEVALRSANSAWARPDVTWKPAYLETLARFYGAGVRLTDFGTDPEGSRTRINDWVADQTEGKITDLVPEGAIDALTALAVVNAVYFKAPWAEPFEQVMTRPGSFTTAAGTVKQAQMMHAIMEKAEGRTRANWQAATLPYLGEKVAMTVLLPDEGKDAAVAEWLSGGGVTEVLASEGKPTVALTMPKFRFRSSVALKEVLQTLGVKDAFLPGSRRLLGDGRGRRAVRVGSAAPGNHRGRRGRHRGDRRHRDHQRGRVGVDAFPHAGPRPAVLPRYP